MTKLLADQRLCIHVYPSKCIFQDLTTSKVVVVAYEHSGLYILQSSFGRKFTGEECLEKISPTAVLQEKSVVPGCSTAVNKACAGLSLEVLHAKLGHTSLSKMKYIF